ncbi:baculoviral IAP repeat-containing protein [Aspergillus tanneri]|uniref:Uncharacterized protein n=1 Tax=Aspergillus tanneri TaxID=1220188 RepID=A0A5M9N118_9EURO|nr:uncharacterized protein ATNIH1004_001693 [Aspergillus tanneri]KAA8652788.1 hypothetical protein ATNIH1004_001693 [Aspergillus tanneri]
MPPKRIKKIDHNELPPSSYHNPFSVLDPTPQTPKATRYPSRAATRPSTPQQQPPENFIWIDSELASTLARTWTYQNWPLTKTTPKQLAKFGFYHTPDELSHDKVCCFACGIEVSEWTDTRYSTEKLFSFHYDDCVWADLLEETDAFADSCPTNQKAQEQPLPTPTVAVEPRVQPPSPRPKPEEPPQP